MTQTHLPQSHLPPKLQEIVDMFGGLPRDMVLPALLEYSRKVPPLPQKYVEHPEFLQPVPECTSPFALVTEVEDGRVQLHFQVPPEAPTVRGYAGILHAGLQGVTPEEVLNLPDTFYLDMGLGKVLTPLRLRGIGAILGRLKNDLRAKQADAPTPPAS